ncbi:NADH-ubiquinone oxidoreductase-F iron-sulfur binding region domain-containing protein [Catellatospora coxensis]
MPQRALHPSGRVRGRAGHAAARRRVPPRRRPRGGRHLRALQVGGPLGGFLAPDQLDLPLLASALDAAGVALGHGGIIAVDDSVTAAQLLAHLWRFYASESCGACTPCREGTRRGAADPAAASADTPLLELMEVASLCPFGRGVPRAVRSLRRALGEDCG